MPRKPGCLKSGRQPIRISVSKSKSAQHGGSYVKAFDEPAIVGKRNVSDYEVHRLLTERGFERVDSEWFRCTAEDVKDALDFLKQKYRNEDKRKDLEQKFYDELRNWYFGAVSDGGLPPKYANDYSLRIIVRLLLCLFLKEKGVIPDCLFEKDFIEDNLKENKYRYYKVVIRNLFFYSLNTPMNKREELENKNIIKNYGNSL